MFSSQVSIPGYEVSKEIYNGSRTIVYQGYRESDSLPVVIKLLKNFYPSFSELVQFRSQYTIAKNFNTPGIIQTYSLEPYQNGYILVMEDFGGISLKDYFTNNNHVASLDEFLQIAIDLCDTLYILYRQRIIHKDIKPSNILINPETKQVKLIDFSIASLLPRETQFLTSPQVLEGTLSYLSPEQTGRMNRVIDYRTDFYSLGVTFYELLTGQLPFPSNDPMELVHCHIAKMPNCVSDVKLAIPKVIDEIISKLMAKNAEERYQSALGLKQDLEKCLYQIKETGKLTSFGIGKRDICDRFLIPEKLYGRETEVQQLLAAFERVSQGNSELMLVAGFSGVGKTVVVNEVHKPIVRQHGYFIKGKFDQFQRNSPFSAFVQAFRDLMGQLFTESDAQIQQWKSNILKAVGENGQVIIEVIPELTRIIGEQLPAPELSGMAAQNRFNLLFQKFTKVFTTAEHPLVIFLDDLQWADSASLKLIQLLMADTGYLFIIGAYRNNEVNPAHPLILSLSEIEKTLAKINRITLAPLSQLQVNCLVADTLKCSESSAWNLAQLVSQKTKGNPFFATQFLKGLHQDNFIQFDLELGCWQCDVAQVTTEAITDDVVDFMALQLRRLPPSTQEVLQLAACIGNQFDLATLAIVSEHSEVETAACLWKALQEGLILPTGEIYKFYVGQDSLVVTQENFETVTYKFLHDRVQQAAYSLIPDEQKKTTHYQIGQQLLKNTSDSEQEERIFEIVNQINVAVELIQQPVAREELAKLNLIAGRKAKNSTAYSAAVKYFGVGRNLLIGNSWKSQYNLTLELYVEATEAAYLNTDIDEMEDLVEVVLQQAKTALDTVKVYAVRISAYTSQGQLLEAINNGLTILKQFKIDLPKSPDLEDVARVGQETQTLLGSKQPSELLNLPEMTNPQILAVMQILNAISVPAYLTKPNLNSLIIMIQMNLSITYGNAPISALSYSSYGLFLCAVAGDIEQGYEFGKLALNLLSKFKEKKIEARVLFVTTAFIVHWKVHVRETLKLLQNAYSSGWESGSLTDLGYAAYGYGFHAYFMGYELSKLEPEMTAYSKVLSQINQQTQFNYNELYRQSILNLLDQTASPFLLFGEANREQELLARYQQKDDKTGLWHFFLNKLILCYLFQEFEQALEYIERAKHYSSSGKGMFNIPVFYFYACLTWLTVFPKRPKSEQEEILQKVATNQKKMQEWTSHNPMNHLHKFYLVEAEQHRVLGEYLEAMENYDLAISVAKENEYIQEEALANELAAKFYLDWGKEKVAQAYLQEAYYCYAHWGAKAKVKNLEKNYPQLLQPVLKQQHINLSPLETIAFHETSSSTHISNILDFTSALKAAQAISSSLELDQLITSLTRIILENSGAKKAILILHQENIWQVRAITFINYKEIQTILKPQSLDNCQDVPINIINYVKNTQQTVVIDNCKTNIPGLIGEYMWQHQPQSVFCTPIINQGFMVGIIYLENQLTQGVFTSDRQSMIKLLCTQAAISLENAQLYTHLQDSKARFQRLADNAPGMIYQFQLLPDGISRFNYVSTGCYEIYEISPEQVVADASSLISAVPPEDMADYQESVSISAQTLEPWRYEGRIITSSGKVKWIQAASRPIKQADGTIVWDGLLLDVTERKQAEAAIFQKSQELKKALEDLQQAQLQIVQSEKMSALGNLVAGVAHEMNNPLGFIFASLQQAKPTVADIVEHLKLYQKTLSSPSDEIKEHAEDIDLDYSLSDLPKMIDSMSMACERLKNISISLRTFSRADKDYKVPFNIHEGIDSTILILKHRLKANEQHPAIEVITDYGSLPQIECFPGQLNQVFMNILANAIDTLDELNMGRAFKEIKDNPNQIIIKTFLENTAVKITIADNGKGMTEEVKQKIFDHLFTTKAVGKGTGLGLAIAHSIVVEKHCGTLNVNSTPGEGTEFVIKLPILAQTSSELGRKCDFS